MKKGFIVTALLGAVGAAVAGGVASIMKEEMETIRLNNIKKSLKKVGVKATDCGAATLIDPTMRLDSSVYDVYCKTCGQYKKNGTLKEALNETEPEGCDPSICPVKMFITSKCSSCEIKDTCENFSGQDEETAEAEEDGSETSGEDESCEENNEADSEESEDEPCEELKDFDDEELDKAEEVVDLSEAKDRIDGIIRDFTTVWNRIAKDYEEMKAILGRIESGTDAGEKAKVDGLVDISPIEHDKFIEENFDVIHRTNGFRTLGSDEASDEVQKEFSKLNKEQERSEDESGVYFNPNLVSSSDEGDKK